MATTEQIAPDALLLQTNLVGALSAIQDDPSSPDATWLTASSTITASVLRVSFPSPTIGTLNTGAGLQTFKAWVRKNGGTGSPTATLELWESGVLKATVLAATSVTSATGQMLTGTWDASLLTAVSGVNVECRITGTVGGSGGQRATIEVGAVRWVASEADPIAKSTTDTLTSGITDASSLVPILSVTTIDTLAATMADASSTVKAVTNRLVPDGALTQTNLTGALSVIQDDPDAPDANWMTSAGAVVLRVSFPTPAANLMSGFKQEFRIRARPGS